MKPVEPFKPKHRSEDLGDCLRLIIPSKKNRYRMIAYTAILMVWGSAAVLFGAVGISGYPSEGMYIFFTFSCVFVMMLSPMLLALLWQWVGVEEVSLSDQTICIRKLIGKIGPQKNYDVHSIVNFRVACQPIDYYSSTFPPGGFFLGISDGWITFDYGARTIRFANGIDEAKARMIFNEIAKKFPQLT